MPRYRYKCAFINAPALRSRWIKIDSVSNGILLLEVIGAGTLRLSVPAIKSIVGPRFCPEPALGIESLKGKLKDEVWKLFDRQTDIERGRHELYNTLHTLRFPANLARYHDEEVQQKLRHFAALIIADIRLPDQAASLSQVDAAMAGAELSDSDRKLALSIIKNGSLKELLARQ